MNKRTINLSVLKVLLTDGELKRVLGGGSNPEISWTCELTSEGGYAHCSGTCPPKIEQAWDIDNKTWVTLLVPVHCHSQDNTVFPCTCFSEK
jgi:hypothetical protein